MKAPVLQMKNITKDFGHVRALSDVSLTLEAGQIVGIVGANGSGKSTLMNILFGNSVIKETGGFAGQVCLNGSPVMIRSAQDAIRHGIGMIHQEFVLIPEMSVAENIHITREHTRVGLEKIFGKNLAFLEQKKDCEQARKTLKKLGFEIDESLLVKYLTVNAKQFVEIAREVQKEDLNVLFLDEPTAVLNEEDSIKLMTALKALADQGTAILFCSHRLHEICQICDEALVIRDGKQVAKYKKEELDIATLARDMVGYDVKTTKRKPQEVKEEVIMELREFQVQMPGESLNQVDLKIMKGEILGVTSLSGHGKLALGYGIMGLFPTSGEVYKQGELLPVKDVEQGIAQGLFLLPDDRKQMGLLMEHSIKENMIFSAFYGKRRFTKGVFGKWHVRDKKAVNQYVQQQIHKLDIKCTNEEQKVRELSGGNQQKVCIARANAMEAEMLFVLEPTRGVDIGAKEKILDLLVEMNEKNGTTVVVASSELEELKRISDRIVVLCEGKVSAVLLPNDSEEAFALAFTGEEAYIEAAEN